MQDEKDFYYEKLSNFLNSGRCLKAHDQLNEILRKAFEAGYYAYAILEMHKLEEHESIKEENWRKSQEKQTCED